MTDIFIREESILLAGAPATVPSLIRLVPERCLVSYILSFFMKPPYTLFNASLNIIILKTVKTVVTRFASLNMIWITVLSIIFFELGSFGSIPECEFPGDLLLKLVLIYFYCVVTPIQTFLAISIQFSLLMSLVAFTQPTYVAFDLKLLYG